MKYYAFNILFFFIYSFSYAQVERPKVVIGIVVDQMRADYLSKFYPHFGEGGFKRLMEQGYWCQNTYYNYKPTYTGPGHASIFTGTVPAVHGIVANHWYSREEEREVYCVSRVVNEQISHSPDRLLSRTLADELKMAQNFRSQSIGISLKDRGAILPLIGLKEAERGGEAIPIIKMPIWHCLTVLMTATCIKLIYLTDGNLACRLMSTCMPPPCMQKWKTHLWKGNLRNSPMN